MKMRNKTGPSTDPCGTPLHTGLQLKYEPSRHTYHFVLCKKLRLINEKLIKITKLATKAIRKMATGIDISIFSVIYHNSDAS